MGFHNGVLCSAEPSNENPSKFGKPLQTLMRAKYKTSVNIQKGERKFIHTLEPKFFRRMYKEKKKNIGIDCMRKTHYLILIMTS